MTDSASLLGAGSNGMDYKQEVYSKCFKCTDLENQLQEVRSQLSSFQLIIKLLYKELKEATQKDEGRTEIKTTSIFPPNGQQSEPKDIVITKLQKIGITTKCQTSSGYK
jgi:hypothetical protein